MSDGANIVSPLSTSVSSHTDTHRRMLQTMCVVKRQSIALQVYEWAEMLISWCEIDDLIAHFTHMGKQLQEHIWLYYDIGAHSPCTMHCPGQNLRDNHIADDF